MGGIALATVFTGLLLLRQPLGFAQSGDPLMGDAVEDGLVGHVEEGALGAPPTPPPAGGVHYTSPSPAGVFERPVDDGYLVHSLEHGIIWFSYAPTLIGTQELRDLESLAAEHSNDVILAPRLGNDVALYAVSWGRRLEVDPRDGDLLRAFIETNRNRSPEPGIR